MLKPLHTLHRVLAPCACRIALLAGACCSLAPALAAPGDEGIDLLAGIGAFHDDNLFRLPDGHPGFRNQRSDSARHAHVGARLDSTWGRQKVHALAKVTKVAFSHFDQLDYLGKDVQARWDWQLGNRFDGALGASYEQALAPYTDVRSSQRNLRAHRRWFADGAWRLHPSWRVRAGAARDKYTYALLVQRFNDRTEEAVEFGADYLPRSGSTVGLVARRVRGDFLQRGRFSPFALDERFEQDEFKARIHWLASGSSTVQVLAGYARRNYRALGERDASGFNGRVTAIYQPVGKWRATAAAWREFSAVESNVISYSLNKGASVGATWDASAKIRAEASASYEQRNYNPRVLLSAPQDLDDSLTQAKLAATWRPRRTLDITAALARQERSGSPFLGLGRFKATTVSLSASAQF